MTTNLLRRSILLALVTLAASVTFAVSPALSAPSHKSGNCPQNQDPTVAWIEDRQAQNQVFSGHDGHIGPPTAEEWARYQSAEAKLNAERPLFPCPERQDKHRRHKR